jgi:Ca2+-binding RTX toxin-like protein
MPKRLSVAREATSSPWATPSAPPASTSGGGLDVLTLAAGANSATIANIETIVGGSLADLVMLTSALTSAGSINLGAGADTLRLANLTNTGTISNVETITGGSGNDTITLGAAVTGGSIDLGGGADRLMLGAFTNSVTVANVETIVGGSGADTIVLTGSAAATVIGGGGINFITGGSGGDIFVLDQASSNAYSVVRNFGAGDRIALDIKSVSTFGTGIYNLGGASLADGTTITKVADSAGRLAARLNNGAGAFVYQQNTGALYYSASGNFSGGGIEVGQVTTNDVTAWTYDVSKFVAV